MGVLTPLDLFYGYGESSASCESREGWDQDAVGPPSRAPTRLGRQPVRRQNRSLNFLFDPRLVLSMVDQSLILPSSYRREIA